MPAVLDWWCGLFGYDGCKAVSVFESLVLFVLSAGIITLISAVVAGVVMAAFGR